MQEIAEDGPAAVRSAAEIATTIAEKSGPFGVRTVLDSAHRAREHGESAAIERLRPDIARLLATEDGAEGIRSFAERRDAVFTGR
ncbi:hypothetical protein GCM10009854_40000 [Saccharopolyspora halophila]|uniref:Enoyl-CoA hydratase n=1 Tax=Saccharopolyspora halophila TaxID=405551 RepID=A0ABN3GPJ8_9PSEU